MEYFLLVLKVEQLYLDSDPLNLCWQILEVPDLLWQADE